MSHIRIKLWIELRLQALHRQPVLAFATLALIVLMACFDAALIMYLRQQAIATSERDTRNLSYLLAEQTDRAFQSAKLVTGGIVEMLETEGIKSVVDFEMAAGGPHIQSLLRDKIVGIPHIDNVSIKSASGKLVNRSRPGPLPEVDQTERDYVTAARLAAPGELTVSVPVKSRTTGKWSIFLSQRVAGAEGEFLGVVSVVIELETLGELYSSILIGPNGSILIARRDGVILARHPRIEPVIGTSLASRGAFPQLVFKGLNGVIHQSSPLDGMERIVASHMAPHFPVVMIVTASLNDVLAEWRRQKAGLVAIGVLAALLLALLALVLARGSQQLAAAQAALALAEERARSIDAQRRQHDRFSAAISNMRQGLAMFDRNGALIVCNPQYGQLYKVPEELCVPGTYRSDILEFRKLVNTDPRTRTREQRGESRMTVNELHDGRIISIIEQGLEDGGWVSTHEDITEKRRSEDKVLHLARHDALTGLPNRLYFKEKLEACLAGLGADQKIAVHYLDLDRFKEVNDTLGHPAGDDLLRKVAARLASTLRQSDILARLGGDEFGIIQHLQASAEEATALASRINDVLGRPFSLDKNRVVISSSVGISLAPAHTRDPDQIVKNADMALYVAKGKGRGRHQFFEKNMEDETRARMQLSLELRRALKLRQFELYYQPQVRLADSQLIGFEALLRWNHPTRGVLAPGEFIQLAEETGLIIQMGEWVIGEACKEAAKWPAELRVGVNLSVTQLRSNSLTDCVEGALRRSGLPASKLELEVTETVMLNETDTNILALFELRKLGVKISMDDFGTGYSSLSCLRLFPFDKLKIDRCFVSELGERADCAAIVRSAASLAKSLGMTTTAEGIETEQQLIAARLEGCVEGQGYLFGRPMPLRDAWTMIDAHRGRKVA